MKTKWVKWFGTGLLLVILSLFSFFIYLNYLLTSQPTFSKSLKNDASKIKLIKKVDYTFANQSFIHQIDDGLFEMLVTGNPIERGQAIGLLTSDLHNFQEEAFINQIKKIVPNPYYLKFLKYFVAFFNRSLEEYIPIEYLKEIYSESTFMSSKYDSIIGPPYLRLLNYHAAHDIGHSLQDRNFVAGCTSFAAWGQKTTNGNLLIGRNFDFYVGDDFAKNKIVAFYNPTEGIRFGMVTWPGMLGVVSGMNMEQITVTINAAKSDITTESKTPISILAREILQYASTLEEAIKIAKKREIFVSESILVGSGKENKAIIIEKSPRKMGIFQTTSDRLLCTNHFQSKTFKSDSSNIKSNALSSTLYRYNRLEELFNKYERLDRFNITNMLRNHYGMEGKNIGLGNENTINQLIAHHSIIFEPSNLKMWVSTTSNGAGEYHAFDLNKVFLNLNQPFPSAYVPKKNIYADSNIINNYLKPYHQYQYYFQLIHQKIKNKDDLPLSTFDLNKFLESNPKFFQTYETLGDYYLEMNDLKQALFYYNKAVQCNLPSINDLKRINSKIKNH